MLIRDVARTVTATQKTFCLLSDAKAFLGIGDTSHDTDLNRYIDAVTTQIEAYTNNILVGSTVVETIIPDDPPINLVLSYPKVTVSAIQNDDNSLTFGDYFVSGSKGFMRRTDGLASTGKIFTVTYALGYDAADYAAGKAGRALFEAALECVRDLYNTKSRPLGLLSETVVNVGARTYSADDGLSMGQNGVRLPLVCAGLLAPYARTGWIG